MRNEKIIVMKHIRIKRSKEDGKMRNNNKGAIITVNV